MGKLTGWHTLKIDDVRPTVSTALRLYKRNRPALNMRSRIHELPDGVTEWRIRCDGKPIGFVTPSGRDWGYLRLRPIAQPLIHGVRLERIREGQGDRRLPIVVLKNTLSKPAHRATLADGRLVILRLFFFAFFCRIFIAPEFSNPGDAAKNS